MQSDSTALDTGEDALPFHFDTAIASGVFVRMDVDQDLDCDLKPNPEDFSISLPVCEANTNSNVRPIALQLKPQPTADEPRTSIILVLEEPLPPVSELELHYHPQEALMWSNTLDDSINAFITHIPVKLSRHEPKEAFSTKLLETIAKKAKPEAGPPPEEPVITAMDEAQISIALNRFLIPHQGVAVGDFRAEAQDRWCTVAAAAVRQVSSEEPHEIQLALKEPLQAGDVITIAFKAKRYPITSMDGSQITNFKVAASYQGPNQFSVLAIEEGAGTTLVPASNENTEAMQRQALETILDEKSAPAAEQPGAMNKLGGLVGRKKASEPKERRPIMTFGQKIILALFFCLVAWLGFTAFQLSSGFSETHSDAPPQIIDRSINADADQAAESGNGALLDTTAEPCSLTFDSGNLYDGTCNGAGKPHGQGNFQWVSGSSYEGNFFNGHRQGNGFMTYPNGAKYEGQWMNDKKHGQGTYWSETGNRFEGEFEHGNMTSNGTCFMADGSEVAGFCPN
ncbi:hypothetical protein [Halioxenophilus aromaticivorans]